MAPVSVPVRIICDNKQLEFKHDIPTSLLGPSGLASPAAQSVYVNAVKPIIRQHQKAALEHNGKICSAEDCTRDASQVNMTPMSYLNLPDPSIAILTVSHCGNEQCDIKLRQEVASLMQEQAGKPSPPPTRRGPAPTTPGGKEAGVCRVCQSTDGVLKCGRCRAVGYCSKEHQRQDWARHKAGCQAV